VPERCPRNDAVEAIAAWQRPARAQTIARADHVRKPVVACMSPVAYKYERTAGVSGKADFQGPVSGYSVRQILRFCIAAADATGRSLSLSTVLLLLNNLAERVVEQRVARWQAQDSMNGQNCSTNALDLPKAVRRAHQTRRMWVSRPVHLFISTLKEIGTRIARVSTPSAMSAR
jgi:hypothetical protein